MTPPTDRRAPNLAEQARRQALVLEKLEREGYACEVRDARRRLRRLQAKLPASAWPVFSADR